MYLTNKYTTWYYSIITRANQRVNSEETKSKMSNWQKGVPKPTITCEHCNKTISDLNYKRWHGNNCKLVLLQ